MLDTFAFASQAIGRALGVQCIYSGPAGHRTVDAVLGAGFERVESGVGGGDVRVSSRRLEIQVTAADFDTEDTDVEAWTDATIEFIEGPLAPEICQVVNATPDIEGVSLTLKLKRAS